MNLRSLWLAMMMMNLGRPACFLSAFFHQSSSVIITSFQSLCFNEGDPHHCLEFDEYTFSAIVLREILVLIIYRESLNGIMVYKTPKFIYKPYQVKLQLYLFIQGKFQNGFDKLIGHNGGLFCQNGTVYMIASANSLHVMYRLKLLAFG